MCNNSLFFFIIGRGRGLIEHVQEPTQEQREAAEVYFGRGVRTASGIRTL